MGRVDREAQPQGGSLAREGRFREYAQSCTPLQEQQTGLWGLVGGWDSLGTKRESRKPRHGGHSQGPEDRVCGCQMHPFLSPNRWQPCNSLKSYISQPPLQILMAP